MEALTALSVATSVIQFLDFGSKLLSNSRKFYRSSSGMLSEHIDVGNIVRDLMTLVQALKRKLPENRVLSELGAGGDERSILGDVAAHEDVVFLDDLCKRCAEIAEELLRRLEKLKADKDGKATTEQTTEQTPGDRTPILPSRAAEDDELGPGNPSLLGRKAYRLFHGWRSFRKALEAAWSKKEIEGLLETLREFRSEIEFRMIIMFRGSLNSLAIDQSRSSQQLIQSTQAILDSFLQARDCFADQLRIQTEHLLEIQNPERFGTETQIRKIEDSLKGKLDPIGNFQSPRRNREARDPDSEPSAAWGPKIQEEVRLLMAETGILRSLSFATLRDRERSVELPYRQTFEWIYRDSDKVGFSGWLREGNGIFWINGKLGSGKSTLMKYISDNERTRAELAEWSKDSGLPVETSSFFFWNSGTEDQKSQQGLLRSLLVGILQSRRELLPLVFPHAWSAWSARATALVVNNTRPYSDLLPEPAPWTMGELKSGFRAVVDALRGKVKLCLFIDGLDEYAGEYFDITEFFLEYANSPDLKLCISSRPILALTQAFGGMPGIRLQDLTKSDISYYVKNRLESHAYLALLSARKPEDVASLVDEIVSKASGVFLWVKLVVRSLLRGMSDYNRISDLRRRVRHLPEDLEALYAHMLGNTEPLYHQRASELFRIVRLAHERSPSRLTLLTLSWAEEEDVTLAETAPVKPLSAEELAARCETMDARLRIVCSGLLESTDRKFSDIVPDAKVDFLHRTASDWMAKAEVWDALCSWTAGSGFSANLALLRSCVLALKTTRPGASLVGMRIPSEALAYAQAAEAEMEVGFPRLLDQLDVAVSYHWRMTQGNTTTVGALDKAVPGTLSSRIVEAGRLHHWSYGLHIPGVTAPGEAPTFYELARALGLSHYVAAKDDSGVIVDQDVNQHLLSHAVATAAAAGGCEGGWEPAGRNGRHGGRGEAPDPRFVDTALEAGANPNFSYNGASPWETALSAAARHFSLGSAPATMGNADPQWELTARGWAGVLEAFVRHGADTGLVARVRQRHGGSLSLSPRAVVELFPACMADEADHLHALLDERGEGAKHTPARGIVEKAPGLVPAVENRREGKGVVSWTGWALSWFR